MRRAQNVGELFLEVVFARLQIAHELAALDANHSFLDAIDRFAVVCCEDDSRASFIDVKQEIDDFRAGLWIEIAGRFVTDDECRFVDERARERGALAFATGEL